MKRNQRNTVLPLKISLKGMKTILLISLTMLFSCSSTLRIKEGKVYKTKEYIGMYLGSHIQEDYTFIQTTRGAYKVRAEIAIPDSSWCYMRIEPCRWDMHPDIADNLSSRWISWIGSKEEYRVY